MRKREKKEGKTGNKTRERLIKRKKEKIKKMQEEKKKKTIIKQK